MLLTVDTLDFAVPDCSIDFLLHFLGLEDVDFEEGKTMRNNYKKSLFITGFKVGYDNPLSQYDCYVNMSGQGCRWYESLIGDEFDWFYFIKSLCELNVDFRRIDIAVDDYSDLINVQKLIQYYSQKKYAGSLRKCFGYVFGKEEFQAGSSGAPFIVRIYNKALERGYTEDDLGHPWYRCELQLRDNHAKQFISEWISSGDLASIYCGHLLEGVRFLTKPNDKKNSQRISVAPFWKKFCQNAQRLKFISTPGIEYNLSKLDRFLNHQVASSIRTYIAINQLTPEQLYNHFNDDEIRLNKDQLALLKANENYTKYLYSKEFEKIPVAPEISYTKDSLEKDLINHILGSDEEPEQLRLNYAIE